jgi:hypothetical protein
VGPRARRFGEEEKILSVSRYPGSLSGSMQLIVVTDLQYKNYTGYGKWSRLSDTYKALQLVWK